MWEVRRYGADNYADPDYVSIYGLKPDEWFARGVRLLGRTAVECTRDRLAQRIGDDIAKFARAASATKALVVDPFAGSGNTLYWILSYLPGSKGIGIELDDAIFALSRKNASIMGVPIEFIRQDYAGAVKNLRLATDELLVVFVAPPWGDALTEASGLDLRRTQPPVAEVIDCFEQAFTGRKCLFATQVYETLDPQGLAEVQSRLDWCTIRIYELNAPGQNHGILLGTSGWTI